MNSIQQQLIGSLMQNNPMMSQMNSMMQSFQQFAATMTPQGAKQQVMQLLQSGQMSQQQFDQLTQMAKNFNFFK